MMRTFDSDDLDALYVTPVWKGSPLNNIRLQSLTLAPPLQNEENS